VKYWHLYIPESQRVQGPLPLDAEGRFRFDAVSPGNYYVQIYITGKLRPDGDSRALLTRRFTVPLSHTFESCAVRPSSHRQHDIRSLRFAAYHSMTPVPPKSVTRASWRIIH